MKKLLLSVGMLMAISSYSQSFTPGNVVVYRYGDGSAAMPNATLVPVYLDEFTPTGTLVGTKVIPAVGDGTNKPLTGMARVANGTYQQEGMSTISADGKYITIFGYNATLGTPVPTTADALVVGVIAADGSYNSTTTLSNEGTGGLGAPRSAITNGTSIWANGFQNGVRYTALGGTSSTRVSVQQNAPRTLSMFGDALYAPIGSSANLPFADPAPSTSTTFTTSVAISSPTPTTNQAIVFMVGGRLRMYIADDGASTGNTIRRYYINDAGTTWVADGTITSAPATTFVKSVAIQVVESGGNTVVDVYATTWGNDGTGTETSKLIKVTDTYSTASPKNPPSTSTLSVLATAPQHTLFRSVTPAPVGSSAIGSHILPVTIKSFNAAVEGQQVKIWWSTFNEVNVKEFVIERSADAITYQKVGAQAAKNATQLSSYTFTDVSNAGAAAYYRLKMVDKDGSFTYSTVVRVTFNKIPGKISVAPNPVVGSSMNVTHNKAGKDVVIRIFSLEGRVMQSLNIQEGATQTVVMLNQLPKGNYIVELSDASGKSTTTIVKQ